ncbi:MAG: PEP-utilizing enzyme [Acidimicrobiales bacterium]
MRSRAWRAGSLPDGLLPLGSGRAGTLGPKAALLDRLAADGLAVPEGVILLDGAPSAALHGHLPPGPLAVRSAFSLEDGSTSSLAGGFRTELRVDASDVDAAVARVRASADGDTGGVQRDVLVMRLVEARHAGVAFTDPDRYDDVVNVTAGTAERLVGGEVPGRRLTLGWWDDVRAEGNWAPRLQRLLAAVRRRLGPGPQRRGWDVEWADDGRRCWLVQARAITAPLPDPDRYTIANHAEILPALPSTFMTSLIASCDAELWAWYRRLDPGLPSNRRLVAAIGGRPMLNLSLLEDLLRRFGLPSRLVAQSFGGEPVADRPARPVRVLRSSPALARYGWAQVRAVAGNRRLRRRLASSGAALPADPSFEAVVDAVRDAYVGLVTGMFPLSAAVGGPVAVLRRAGTLVEHAGRHRSVTSALAEALADARPGDTTAFVTRFGHRGVYESDLARPRFAEAPPTPGPARPRVAAPPRTLAGWLTAPVWWLARPALDARESLRNDAMRGFADVRYALRRAAARAVERGALSDVDDLWLCTVDEAVALDAGWRLEPADADGRRRVRDALAQAVPPALVGPGDDPTSWRPGDAPVSGVGLTLVPGVVSGRAWVLHEPAPGPPPFDGPVVLVARSVDAGWVATFTHTTGVAVETGGDLSHGSILLREQGICSITNAPGITRAVRTGDPVTLDASLGVLVPQEVPHAPIAH